MSTLIRNVAVFNGTELQPRHDVLLDGPAISAVGTGLAVPAGATVVDGTGRTLLPGLIDAHTHATGLSQLRQSLVFGVTTELDMGGTPELARTLRAAARERDNLADLRIATTGATAPHGHPTQLVELGMIAPFPTIVGPADTDAFVEQRVAEGADHLKIFIEDGTAMSTPMPTMSSETVVALVRAAHARDLKTAAHTLTRASARQAIDCGIDGLAHAPADGRSDDELIEAAVRAGVFVVPTLVALAGMSGVPAEFALADDPTLRPFADPEWLQGLDRLRTTDPRQRVGPVTMDVRHAADAAARMLHAGVPLLAVTDGTSSTTHPTTHGISYHGELAMLVRAGLSPTEALTAATSAPADAFGLDDRGRIAPGLRADVLLVEGNPLADITALRDITDLWRRGVHVDRTADVSTEEE
ncbi:amidohydrolase family protein [Actinacidiphila soli]|uniref:amidohydrolase family protein n=1 Tax=Actinacidiphila soli TaxID=2487275 RepID=UPI000FC9F227|nr:amidohydrolase family protein [Actinacidiphila soli]